MNEYGLIAVSVISGIFGLIGLQMLQQNWYKREDLKYKFDVKRAKLRRKNVPVKATSTPTSASDWLDTIKKIDPNIAHDFIDAITPTSAVDGDYEEGSGEGLQGAAGSLVNFAKNNPAMVENFLKGLNDSKGSQQGKELIR